MTLRLKLTCAFLVVSLLIVLFSVATILLQMQTVHRAALLEAEHVATAIAQSNAADDRESLQTQVIELYKIYHRNLFVVDVNKRIIADRSAQEIGNYYRYDINNSIGKTILDGRRRIFVEQGGNPSGAIKQLVVPLREKQANTESPIIGAVVLEYSPIYNDLMREAKRMILLILVIGTVLVSLTVIVGMGVSSSILQPIRQLAAGVDMIGTGNYEIRIVTDSKDEMGSLSMAFNRMAGEVQDSHAKLLAHEQNLEELVAIRTQELDKANTQLQQEVEARKLAAAKIEYLAYHDGLTGLPNRRMFSELINRDINWARRYKKGLAVLFIDLDRFKNINDTLGHDAGDQLLRDAAARLKRCLRDSDALAGLGSDEFVVLIPESSDVQYAAKAARKILATIAEPFIIVDQEFRVTASIGISMYPQDGEDELTLTKHADIAMYQAKEDGKNNFHFYSKYLSKHSMERLILESSLQRALVQNEFQLYYQAKTDIDNGKITGMEALLRWHHADLGIIPPSQFIPIAEETGLIVPIGKWVIKTACLQNISWQQAGLPALRVAVNLSARQFADARLYQDVITILQETGMDPDLLELEITESMVMQNMEKTARILAAFKQTGIRFAIDDFGTGYSSLSTIRQFPVDTIKVDRSFIQDTPGDNSNKAITEAVIAMSKSLGMTVVAEGVETREQLDFLREHACDEFQGFYFNRPLPADKFTEILRANTGKNITALNAANA